MKKNKLMLAFMLSAGLLFGACGSNEPKATEAEAPVVAQTINTTHAYVCPMNCENSASMDPGQCKVCGMDLVKNPNYAGEAGATIDSSTAMPDSMMQGGHDHENHEGHNH